MWYDAAVRRYPGYASVTYTFGPGPLSPAVRGLIVANVAAFLVATFSTRVVIWLGLTPVAVFDQLWVWQPLTYMFLHSGLMHILFNMLALWMFGVELERMWGTRAFLRYYFVTGIGAGATTLVVSLLPFDFARPVYYSLTVGASGAIYGLLLAYAFYYPDRPIYLYLLFPIPAKVFVIIVGALALYASVATTGSGVAHATHLGGLVAGYLYLTRGRGGPIAELRYRYLRWRMARMRRRFGVRDGGRGGWNQRVH